MQLLLVPRRVRDSGALGSVPAGVLLLLLEARGDFSISHLQWRARAKPLSFCSRNKSGSEAVGAWVKEKKKTLRTTVGLAL